MKTDKRIILASNSPRRKELMTLMGLDFQVMAAGDVEKDVQSNKAANRLKKRPKRYVMHLAKQKAKKVYEDNVDALVIGADTVVVLNGKILEKPKDEQQAEQMLKALSGKTHIVYTAVCACAGGKQIIRCDKTHVRFSKLNKELISEYVKSGEPMDKAGAYGIQGKFSVNIPWIRGSYFNVMGLPIHLVKEILDEMLDNNYC